MSEADFPTNSVVEQVKNALNENNVDSAIQILRRSGDRSMAAQNAMAVCLMRKGEADAAVKTLTPLVHPHSGLSVDPDTPLGVKLNYATALLLNGKIAACETTLHAISEAKHPSVVRLREAISKWKRSQSFGRRISMFLGSYPIDAKVTLDLPPGEL